MDTSTRKLRRAQLDKFFNGTRESLASVRSYGGSWIREIRESLGMSMQDLADRMGVIKQRIDRLEKDEAHGKVTIETMKKAAEALECEFVYAIVPKNSLDKTLRNQAAHYVDHLINSTQHTMALEKQSLNSVEQEMIKKNLIDEILSKNERQIWKKK